MPLLTNSLAPYLPNFFLAQLKKYSSCFIHRLPMDIHIDQIFPYLHVEDILCLRRVNKAFYLLTHEPVIWKRFLSKLTIPLPPIRPTFRYALEATDFEIEQLVTRAISLEDNWRQSYPRVICTRALLARYVVLDLKLLPGGKYLVASVKDVDSYHFYVIVFCLDHPNGPRALARFPTKANAIHLQAKYMKYRGSYVIMIAYVCRWFTEGGPMNLDPSDYGPGLITDPASGMKNDLECIRISLDSLEALADPRMVPGSREYQDIAGSQEGPFFAVEMLEATGELNIISLYEMDGMPYLSVVEQPSTIVMVDLHREKKISRLKCKHPLFEGNHHYIRAVRHLPNQKEFLVIHSIVYAKRSHDHVLGLYDMPTAEGKTCVDSKASSELLWDTLVDAFHISDYGIPTRTEDNYRLRRDSLPPPPISIYMETAMPETGIKHVVLWPSVKFHPPDKKTYYYALDHIVPQTTHTCPTLRAKVLPGAYRALTYTVHQTDRTAAPALVNLRRYVNPEYQLSDYPIARVPKSSSHVMRRKHPPLPLNMYCSVELEPEMRQQYEADGVAAITWDEGIGRVCVAAGGSDWIDILDFAHVAQPEDQFGQWKMCQQFVRDD